MGFYMGVVLPGVYTLVHGLCFYNYLGIFVSVCMSVHPRMVWEVLLTVEAQLYRENSPRSTRMKPATNCQGQRLLWCYKYSVSYLSKLHDPADSARNAYQ